MSNAIEIAIQRIEEQENDLRQQKALLQEYANTDLTEENYHRLCHTLLRNSDMLGEDVGKKINVPYVKRRLNDFEYRLPNGWRLMVPSTVERGVNIAVENYKSSKYADLPTSKSLKNDVAWIDREINTVKEYFFEGNTFKRAQYVGIGLNIKKPHRQLFWSKLIYRITNCWKHYEARYTKYIADLERDKEKKLRTFEEEEKKWDAEYEEQEKVLQEYIQGLFNWTTQVRVFRDSAMSRDYVPSEFLKTYNKSDVFKGEEE